MKKNISHKSATSNQEIIDSCDFLSNAASTQDCTGLIPSGPMNEDELESYEAVYHYQHLFRSLLLLNFGYRKSPIRSNF